MLCPIAGQVQAARVGESKGKHLGVNRYASESDVEKERKRREEEGDGGGVAPLALLYETPFTGHHRVSAAAKKS